MNNSNSGYIAFYMVVIAYTITTISLDLVATYMAANPTVTLGVSWVANSLRFWCKGGRKLIRALPKIVSEILEAIKEAKKKK